MGTVNKLKVRIERKLNGLIYVVDIRLSDDCKNGHNDFAITGSIYENGIKSERNCLVSGAIGDRIAEAFPEFKCFNDLHLCDEFGAPMYAVSNGMYHFANTGRTVGKNYLRLTDEEADKLEYIKDKMYFTKLLFDMGVVERWNAEAKEAIKLLEKLSGEVYVSDKESCRQIKLTAEQLKEVKEREATGYYTPEEIRKRDEQEEENKRAKMFQDIKDELTKEVKKHKLEYRVKKAILTAGYNLDNFIFYNHTKEGVFNWKSYDKKITQEEFSNLLNVIKGVPKGVKLSLSTK